MANAALSSYSSHAGAQSKIERNKETPSCGLDLSDTQISLLNLTVALHYEHNYVGQSTIGPSVGCIYYTWHSADKTYVG